MKIDFSYLTKQHMLTDPSFWGVVAGNMLSIFLALSQGWDIGQIMWVYWGQSVMIGVTNFFRILSLKDFSTENFKMNGHAVQPTTGTKIQVAFFFLMHYGIFHLVYAVFLWQQLALSSLSPQQLGLLALCVAGFIGSHGFSLHRNIGRDFKHKKPNIGSVMFYPYLRILPMHLTIIFGNMVDGSALVIFMVLKTFADVGMHVVEHYLFQQATEDNSLKD